MKKAKPPKFGKKDLIVYESTSHAIRKQAEDDIVEVESRKVLRLPRPLFWLILVGILFLPEESRAFISTTTDYLFDIARSWIFRGSLD